MLVRAATNLRLSHSDEFRIYAWLPLQQVCGDTKFHSTHQDTETEAVAALPNASRMQHSLQVRRRVAPHPDTEQNVALVLPHCANMQ